MFGIIFGNVSDVFWTFLGCFLNMFGMFFGNVLDVFWTCFGCFLDMFGMCFGHVWDVFWICLGCVDLTKKWLFAFAELFPFESPPPRAVAIDSTLNVGVGGRATAQSTQMYRIYMSFFFAELFPSTV